MWERNRPYVRRYFARIQQLESFKNAISMTNSGGLTDIFSSPLFWGLLTVVAVAGGGFYLWNRNQSGNKGLPSLLESSNAETPVFVPTKSSIGAGITRTVASTSSKLGPKTSVVTNPSQR